MAVAAPPVLVCGGTVEEAGEQHGAQILRDYDTALSAVADSDYSRLARRRFPRRAVDLARDFWLVRRATRFARGASVTARYLSGVLAAPGMRSSKLARLLVLEMLAGDRTRTVEPGGCSGLAAEVAGTQICAKNFDFQYAAAPFQAIVIRRQAGFYGFVALAPVLMPLGGQFCMNETGLTVSYHYAYSRRGIASNGAPVSLVVHEVLSRCASCREALELLEANRWIAGNGASLSICDSREHVIVELAGRRRGVVCSSGPHCTTNHFQSEALKRFNLPEDLVFRIQHPTLRGRRANESSDSRHRRLIQLTRHLSSRRQVSLVLGDEAHADGQNNIFQTGEFWGTISSCIGIPEDKTIHYFRDVRHDPGLRLDARTLASGRGSEDQDPANVAERCAAPRRDRRTV